MRLPCLLFLAGAAAAQGPLPSAEFRAGEAVLRWDNGTGLTLSRSDTRIWSPVAGELVLHDQAWTVQLLNSQRLRPTATLGEADGRPQLTLVYEAEGFRASQRIGTTADGAFRIDWTYRQDGWDGAGLQLGLGRPREDVFAGAAYGSDRGQGTIPLTYQDRPAIAGVRQLTVRSLFATFSAEADRPLALYDYADRDGHFWLGYDEPLPRGEERTFSAVIRVDPPRLAAGGVAVSDVTLPRRIEDGHLPVSVSLARTDGGPAVVRVLLEATREGGEPVRQATEVALTATPRTAACELALGTPGRYRVSFQVAGGAEVLLASPPVVVEVISPLRVAPGLSLYTTQAEGTVRAGVLATVPRGDLTVELSGAVSASAPAVPGQTAVLSFPLAGLPDGPTELICRLRRGGQVLGEVPVTVRKAPPKPNTVVIDTATGGLLVDGVPTLPVGFYCDHPPFEEMDAEAQAGWTFVGPYVRRYTVDGGEHAELAIRMLDRAHAAGLRVHYCLHTLAVGEETPEKLARLRAEIEAVRDHPALLAWYLADEPELNRVPADRMERVYELVQEVDPYHPCTMVFANRDAAVRYERALDISMTDPYPIPRSPAGSVAASIRQMVAQHGPQVAIWVVPQAFGGGEWWEREPSAREERVMTWLALIEGARGIQYFIRRAPNINPVSLHLWNECRRLAAEIREMAPELLAERTVLETGDRDLHAALTRSDTAALLLMANASAQPKAIHFGVPGMPNGEVEVVGEQRTVEITGSQLDDLIDGYGTRAYRVFLGDAPPLAAGEPGNLVRNASLEDWANVGTPDAYYVSGGSDPAASATLERFIVADGRHALRLVSPVDGGGLTMRPFPIRLRAGQRYHLSLRARADRPGARIRLAMSGIGAEPITAEVGTDWATVELSGTAPEDLARGQITYRLETAGVAWVDALRLVAE